MRDLGADSLDAVELVMTLESEFNIEIPDEKAEHILTVGPTIAFVHDLVLSQKYTNLSSPSQIMSKQKEKIGNTYEDGYQLGLRNGVRRRKRIYREENENSSFGQGYCDGYRAGRKDYKQK
jgi:hypothetical protein